MIIAAVRDIATIFLSDGGLPKHRGAEKTSPPSFLMGLLVTVSSSVNTLHNTDRVYNDWPAETKPITFI